MNRRVVFDTCVLVSGAILVESIPRKAVDLAFKSFDPCGSYDTVSELAETLSAKKFDRYLNQAQRKLYVELIESQTRLFSVLDSDIRSLHPPCRDPKDNIFLAIAKVADAGMIVTSDRDLLVLHPWNGIDILSPADFLRRFASRS